MLIKTTLPFGGLFFCMALVDTRSFGSSTAEMSAVQLLTKQSTELTKGLTHDSNTRT